MERSKRSSIKHLCALGKHGPWSERQYSSNQITQGPLERGALRGLNQAGKVIDKMKQLLLGSLALIAAAIPTPAQKIDTETASREHVVRVQTAMNHLTVIEVAEPVATVAVGSPQAFRVERRENKVLIEPLQENVATNLFIWTASTRLNYELIPAVSDAGQMDFAIDYRQSPQAQVSQRKPGESEPAASAVPAEMLLNSTPVRMVGGPIRAKANVDVLIRDVYRKQDVLLFPREPLEPNASRRPPDSRISQWSEV